MATVSDLQERNAEIQARLQEIDTEAAGKPFTDEQRTEWNDLNEEIVANDKLAAELKARAERISQLAEQPDNVEKETVAKPSFYTRNQSASRVPEDPTRLEQYRDRSNGYDELQAAYTEGALRIIGEMVPAVEHADEAATKDRLERTLTRFDTEDKSLARRIISTSNPTYERAWAKMVRGDTVAQLQPDEQRALSLTNSAGGYAVPVVLDPTVIRVSAGVNNPIRNLSRVESIAGNTWYGISSTGITASYGAASTETTDNAPTLVQPTAVVQKAQAFIPYNIEIGQDWGSLAAEMGAMLADEKDRLESTKFLTGLGSGSSEPQGLIAVGGATAVVTSATTAVFAVGDLYNLEAGLSPRFRDNATFVGNKAAYQKIRQFDTSGGASLWVQLPASEPGSLLGYPAHEWSSISSAVTTSASTIFTFGDFSKFLIVDRVGMDVELIPHLFGTVANYPTGQRGLYAYWRNTSTVLTPGLQANSGFVSLKLL